MRKNPKTPNSLTTVFPLQVFQSRSIPAVFFFRSAPMHFLFSSASSLPLAVSPPSHCRWYPPYHRTLIGQKHFMFLSHVSYFSTLETMSAGSSRALLSGQNLVRLEALSPFSSQLPGTYIWVIETDFLPFFFSGSFSFLSSYFVILGRLREESLLLLSKVILLTSLLCSSSVSLTVTSDPFV